MRAITGSKRMKLIIMMVVPLKAEIQRLRSGLKEERGR